MLREPMQLVPLTAEEQAERHIPAVAEWVLDAGNPHLEWLYMGSRERVLRCIGAALGSDRSELWIGHVAALFDKGLPIGGALSLPGRELADRRRTDLIDLIRLTDREQRAELRRRVEAGKDLYLPVEPQHCFLSKFGLLSVYRGKGLGAALLDAFISSTWEDGYEHIRLDVAERDERAVHLYESRGFQVIGARTLQPLGVQYFGMILAKAAHA